MGLFSIFKKDNNINETDLPWNSGQSIFDHIKSNLDDKGHLTDKGNSLPDEEKLFSGKGLRWAPGALDGAFGHHGGKGNSEKDANRIAELIKSISQSDSQSKKLELYNLLSKDSVMDFIDIALERITKLNVQITPYLHSFVKVLATRSPDRGPVKFAIALLGPIGDPKDLETIMTLGKHEEFTLFSSVAVGNSMENPESSLFELAKYVDGWGRIQIVERLAETKNSEIKKWLVREGYQNSVMYEYLAYTCAVAGNLKEELSKKEIDVELFSGAGDIIEALIAGGPAQDIYDYEDAVEVVSTYLRHASNMANKVGDFLALNSIKRFLENDGGNWEEQRKNGWTDEMRNKLLIEVKSILNNPKWRQIAIENQDSSDRVIFWQANQIAEVLGIDTWDTNWQRLKKDTKDQGQWYNVIKKANSERIDQVLALINSELDMKQVATGVSDELGLGPEYNLHGILDYILQELGRFPNKGTELILIGLNSPVTRNRNMALRALSAWGKDSLTSEIISRLEQLLKIEPNKDAKKNIKNVLDGKPLD